MVPTVDKLPFYDDLFPRVNQKTDLASNSKSFRARFEIDLPFSETFLPVILDLDRLEPDLK
ncbi:hypothetical protein [Chamaesiphon sp. OTE_75_metabat_556]|uniref:hypothetical protein n=1 Tax=Chamaesiphon sp. OTE_75_metabat_556 TaxID=2964692 RepID=UPI00286B6FD0|nr:hypothetical protein [Chamaesiphon sp. OTE_75_metabat_556]